MCYIAGNMGVAETRILKFSSCFPARDFQQRLVVRLEAGIAATSGGGLHTGLRVAGAAKNIFIFFKNVTLLFLSILYA